MANNPSSPACPDCGAALPPVSPYALCAACLLRQALASQTLVDDGKSAPVSPPLTPEEIAGRFPGFEILECLGRGGMGVVYKARQKSLDRWVAIKIVAPEKHGEERFSGRFAREAATLAKLSHPNIVTIHDFGETDGLFYIVMEHVDGVNLRDLVSDGRLDPEQALAIVPPICDALQYAHEKGVVHRDIKPENILLDRDGRVRIADFGIAALMGGPGEPAGTPPYAAPEQTVPNTTADHRADIHALGVVFYEMLTGERPTGEIIAPSKRADTDSRLDDMVLRAMARNPADRFQTAGDFRTAVDSVGKPPEAGGKRSKRRRWAHPAATVVLLGSVAFLSWKLAHPPVTPSVVNPEKETTGSEPKVDVSTMRLDDHKVLWEMKLNPEQALVLLERAKRELKSESKRAEVTSAYISRLCGNEHAQEAWKLVSTDAGKVRDSQLAAWFTGSRISLSDRLKHLGELTDAEERKTAFRFLLSGPANVDEICGMDFNRLPLKSPEERMEVASSLYRIFSGPYPEKRSVRDNVRILGKCLDLSAEGWLNPSEAVLVFQYAGHSHAFEQWDLVQRVKWDLPENAYKMVRDQVLKNMAAADPERAIRTLVSGVPAKERDPFLAIVYRKMHDDAPGTCVEKVKALFPELDEATRQQLSERVIREALQTGELELAREWMALISNGKLRVEFAEAFASALERRKKYLEKGLNYNESKEPRPF